MLCITLRDVYDVRIGTIPSRAMQTLENVHGYARRNRDKRVLDKPIGLDVVLRRVGPYNAILCLSAVTKDITEPLVDLAHEINPSYIEGLHPPPRYDAWCHLYRAVKHTRADVHRAAAAMYQNDPISVQHAVVLNAATAFDKRLGVLLLECFSKL